MRYTTAQINSRILEEAHLPYSTLVLSITESINDYSLLHGVDEDFVITPARVMSFMQRALALSDDNAVNTKLILATCKAEGDRTSDIGNFCFLSAPTAKREANSVKYLNSIINQISTFK
jgi:hypothetical protein